MSAGEGFARRVTLVNLHLFAPLLKRTASQETSRDADEQVMDVANQDLAARPEMAAAEALFSGVSIPHSRETRERSRPGAKTTYRKPGSGQFGSSDSGEVLLMRVKPRRDGKQLQISMIVHRSFMRKAREVVSANDGSRRSIGYDRVKRGGEGGRRKKNTARFEVPELKRMKIPVARFTWVYPRHRMSGILQYEVFDADRDGTGKKILRALEQGIAEPPTIDLRRLSQVETVLSKSNRASAQWYKLHSVGS